MPARNAEGTVGAVVAAMPPHAVRSVVVVDNASEDATARVAEDHGALVVREPRVGYGAACLRGLAHLSTLPRPPDVVVFCAADGSDDAAQIPTLVAPLRESLFDLVIGARGRAGVGSFMATKLIHAVYGHRYSDVGPFRAIRYPALIALGMRDPDYGWLVEMQVRALKCSLRIAEVHVEPKLTAAAGEGGLTTRVKDVVGAGTKTLYQILRHSTAR